MMVRPLAAEELQAFTRATGIQVKAIPRPAGRSISSPCGTSSSDIDDAFQLADSSNASNQTRDTRSVRHRSSGIRRQYRAFINVLLWRLDTDFAFESGFRVVQFTPPRSACSIRFGTNITVGVGRTGDERKAPSGRRR